MTHCGSLESRHFSQTSEKLAFYLLTLYDCTLGDNFRGKKNSFSGAVVANKVLITSLPGPLA